MRTVKDWVEMPIEKVQRMARILGASSAAQLALDDYEERKRHGETPAIYWSRLSETLLVGPRVETITG